MQTHNVTILRPIDYVAINGWQCSSSYDGCLSVAGQEDAEESMKEGIEI